VTAVPVVVLLAACSGASSDGAGATGAPSPAASTSATSTSGPPAAGTSTAASPTESVPASPSAASPSPSLAPAPRSTAAASGPAVPAADAELAAAVVKDIRVADQGRFDRVVLEYTGTFGQWTVAYTDKVTNDPVGDDVPLKGTAFLSVRVHDATFDNLFQVGGSITHLAYAGPHRIDAGLPSVFEVADSGDFEAVMGVGIGLDHVTGFKAYRLSDPSRLVIDIAH
jgi:hypothetical protein